MDLLIPEQLPERIDDVEALEELLSRPSQALIDDLAALDGDIIILGVAGKVGVCLARLAKRAAPEKRVVGVARFSDAEARQRLEAWGVETVACDLLDRQAVAALPKLPNVIYMAGLKFGTGENPGFAWAMNSHVPAIVAEAFAQARIVAFSTLCVYPFVEVTGPLCDEDTPPLPIGEYANSCVARERLFQYFSAQHDTPGRLIRLNYAIDLRYGVLFDIASWVYEGRPIDLGTGHANVIWQGDVNAQVLRALGHCQVPSRPLNMGGPEAASVRALADAFGRRFGREPLFAGEEGATAWLNDTSLAAQLFGYPLVPLERMLDWTVDWIERDMPHYDKPTRYEIRDGQF
ncbi:MAG: NAD(P)-dependent oxidoreductase [Alphaproteobacteria bacterium]|jgi:nucleoside-diphosphate-sugar epimerase|nr:NAD(P)-dependent oxidoreductase [Alphaproteobacteria bacterium]MDP6813849.1 NAD(P)-dependent oxidoreductase [Alphaproteobacteria bacterium]